MTNSKKQEDSYLEYSRLQKINKTHMRRIDLINSVTNIQKAIIESKIHNFLFVSNKSDVNAENIIASFQIYSKMYDTFGPNEKRLIELFNLRGLETPKTLTLLLAADKPENRDVLRQFSRGLSYFLEFFPSIVNALRQDHINYSHESSQEEIAISPDESKQILTVILPENHREISSPERLIKALDSIQLFYNVFAKIEDIDSSGLSIAAIDSGSDKSFDFLGAAQLMSSVKELVIELWDRIVFYRERKLHEKLDLVAKSLPILERINALEKEDKVGKEQCELLRRAVIDGANKFISSGAIIPEFQENNYHNPRELMAPEAKLLVESNTTVEKSKSTKSNDHSFEDEPDDLSEQEKELLKKINSRNKNNK